MKTHQHPATTALVIAGLALPFGLGAQTATASSAGADQPRRATWTSSTSLAVRVAYDNNVFLQDRGTLAGRESMVTSLQPALGLAYKAGPGFGAAVNYAPEVVFYHAESSEDYVAHRANVSFTGKVRDTAWEWLNTALAIDGSSLSPMFTGGGDAPAIGGLPLRDRRDAVMYRGGIKVTHTRANTFFRPVLSLYVHDFQTEQHRTNEPGFAGYQNYVDRAEYSGGLDAGYRIAEKTWFVVGYRLGHQEQKKNQHHAASRYSNDYQRFLVGLEGTPAEWLRLNLQAGPDVRNFPNPAPGFDPDEMIYYVDASATLTPSRWDSVTLSARRFQQPAFSSHCVYEDIVYEVSWKHKASDRVMTSAGFKVYGGDWQAPVNREDWIFTPSASLSYAPDRHRSAELAYSYDWVESRVPNTPGREYRRHLVALSAKYSW